MANITVYRDHLHDIARLPAHEQVVALTALRIVAGDLAAAAQATTAEHDLLREVLTALAAHAGTAHGLAAAHRATAALEVSRTDSGHIDHAIDLWVGGASIEGAIEACLQNAYPGDIRHLRAASPGNPVAALAAECRTALEDLTDRCAASVAAGTSVVELQHLASGHLDWDRVGQALCRCPLEPSYVGFGVTAVAVVPTLLLEALQDHLADSDEYSRDIAGIVLDLGPATAADPGLLADIIRLTDTADLSTRAALAAARAIHAPAA